MKTTRPSLPRFALAGVVTAASAILTLADPAVSAQAGAPSVNGGSAVEVDPIKCWWKTGQTSVIVAERFTVTLTCGVIETNGLRVVPNREQLSPGALQLTPFEVVGGRPHDDILAGPWRYFQYEYDVRLVSNEQFGKDVELPSIGVAYNIVSTANDTEGREQTYVLPPLPMRLESLVPKQAVDIRDASYDTTFAAIEARRVRATRELVAAAILFGFAVVLGAAAFARAVLKYRVRQPVAARALPSATVLRGCLRAMRKLKADVAREGWTHEGAARALAALRVAAAVALGRTVAQSAIDSEAPVREGQVALRSGIVSSRRMVVSAATTATAVERGVATPPNGGRPAGRSTSFAEMSEALQVFTAARYSRNDGLDTATLDTALDQAERSVRRLRLRHLWPARIAAAVVRPLAAAAGALPWFR